MTPIDPDRAGDYLTGRITTSDGLPPEQLAAGAPSSATLLNGQHRQYWVLSEQERRKGFVRPYRDAYKHYSCGEVTTMSRSIAETYARDPQFYGTTYCIACRAHFPVAEFLWYEHDGRCTEPVGS